jgi:trk system potassium uptake protein TrkA
MSYAIIVGAGKIGYFLTQSLINRDFEVCLMEKDMAAYRRLAADLGDIVMHGDGCDPLVLRSAGVERADLVVAATGDDCDNLVVCQMAQHCFGRRHVISRVNNPSNEDIFEKLGIHQRVSGTSAVLNLLSQQVGKQSVILLGALEKSSLKVVELIVEAESPFNGARLGDLSLPPDTLIISVVRDFKVQIPTGNTVFEAGDLLIIIVPAGLENTLREFLL